jgi:hypothetical protein
MSLKRFFGVKSSDQKGIVAKDYELLVKRIDEYRNRENQKLSDRAKRENNKCPNCGNNDKKMIVNKISRVQGKGEVSGTLFGIYGSSETDTNDVNHCNECGNQWKKEDVSYIWTDNASRTCLNGLDFHIRNDNARIYNEEKALFDEICIEAIMRLRKKYGSTYTGEHISRTALKKLNYKSVWDKKGG